MKTKMNTVTIIKKGKPVLFERKNFTASGRLSMPGKTSIIIDCPFCNQRVIAYVWSLAGSGKRCGCGAIHHSFGESFKEVKGG